MLKKLGKYRIDGILGTGAMGVVYKAFDVNIERIVALKTIKAELIGEHEDGDLYARFKNEAQASGRLTHPSIVAVYDFGEIDQIAYLAMEYVNGTPLSALLVAGQPTDLDSSISCMTQLLRALDYAHTRGVVHRDVKPANLLIVDGQLLKITDFGIARIESSTLTQVGSVIGTPSYMAPEQFRGEPVDRRTDVFAAGIVFYQLLTGERPFVGSAATVMHQILNEMPADPTTKNPALSPEFNLLLQRAMAKRPEDRFPSAQAFVEALQATHQACSGGSGVSRDSEDDSERTVLVFSSPVSGNEVPEHTEIGGSQGSSTFSTSTAWKAEILPELQTLLSLQVGPMARLLLKSAASNSASLDELCERLLLHIPSEKGRSQFLDGIGSIRKRMASSIDSISSITSTSGHSTSGMTLKTSMAEVAGTRIGLSPEIIEMAGKKLLPYMGPIAPVIVKKTVGRCADRHELFRLLAANLPTADERNRFLRDVGEV